MNKLKKVWTSLSVFFTCIFSKVFAMGMVQTKYGIMDPGLIEDKYGVFEPTMGEKVSLVGKIAIPVVLFFIGLFAILSKKINKRVKIIIVSGLIILGVTLWYVMNFIANNF